MHGTAFLSMLSMQCRLTLMSDQSKVKTTFIRPVNRTMSYEDIRGYICMYVCMYDMLYFMRLEHNVT